VKGFKTDPSGAGDRRRYRAGVALVSALAALGLAACAPRSPNGAQGQSQAPESYQKTRSGYVLEMGDDFRRGMNRVDDLGISIAVAMDSSGSMGNQPNSAGDPKYVQAAEALATVADYLEGLARSKPDMKIKVALVKFSGTVSTVLPLTTLDEAGIAKLRAACVPDNFLPKGGTAIGLALERGASILAQSGTIFNSLIVITDGENTINPSPEDVIKAIYANSNDQSLEDDPVRTDTQLISVIGFDVESPQFARMHDLGARVTSAGNREELGAGLKDLLEADITKLE